MQKEILLYGSINEDSSRDFINALEGNSENDISVRIASNGGEPEYTFGMVAKFAEHKGKKSIKVDGKAFSAACFMLCYADEVEGLDVSEYLIHRSAYPSWIESNPDYFTDAMKGNLSRINTSLQKALESKIDVAVFEQMKGVTVKEIFSMEARRDVFLTAKEAKKIGLINKIVNITPTKRAEIESAMFAITAQHSGIKEEVINPIKNTVMNLETLKAEHPAVFAQAKALGVSEEKDRAGAWLAFVDVDAEAVSTGIKEGHFLTQTAMAELSRKSFSKQALSDISKDSAGSVQTKEAEKPADVTALASFEAEAKMHLGLKN